MPELSRAVSVSRSAFLELRDELRLVNDGYEFLDEKRILLAAEMLRQRELYRSASSRFARLCEIAAGALTDAAADQGLDGLQVFPCAELADARVRTRSRPYVGQTLLEAWLEPGEFPPAPQALRPTAEVRRCRAAFLEILRASAELAALSANLLRLIHEYRRSERRVRALENVVLPELYSDLATMEEYLDLVEQEEVIRVRSAGKQPS